MPQYTLMICLKNTWVDWLLVTEETDEIHEEKELQTNVDDVERSPPSTELVRRHHDIRETKEHITHQH